ncbi:MAG: hypothetical protein ACREQ9_12290, partial [Candidatus Binatia bacterium]
VSCEYFGPGCCPGAEPMCEIAAFCGNGECEFDGAETCDGCPEDCGACVGICGDGVCEPAEHPACAADCVCGSTETCDQGAPEGGGCYCSPLCRDAEHGTVYPECCPDACGVCGC